MADDVYSLKLGLVSSQFDYWRHRANELQREVTRLNEVNATMKLDLGRFLDFFTRARKSWWRRVLLWLLMR